MKDIQKIKEFFSKPIKEGNEEYYKPKIRKDKNNPNFLYIDIAYPAGSGFTTALGSKTMSGRDREEGAAKALSVGNAVAKKLETKYNIEDIDVSDGKNGKVTVFAVSDDFIKMASPSLNEDKKENEYPIVIAKKAYNEYGWKPKFIVVGEYDKDRYILIPIDRFNEWEKTNLNKKPGFNKYEEIVSKSEMENSLNEAKEEDKVDTITMDVPLFIRMLEYSKEDAAEDMDLHDVTEKAISLGKERGILQMEDYDEIVGTTEKVDEANVTWSTLHRDNSNEKLLKQSKLSSAEYQKAKKLQGFKADNYKWNTDEDLYIKVVEEGIGNEVGDKVYFKGDLGEKYPSSQGYYGIIEDTTPARNYNMMAIYQVVVYDKNDNEIRTIKTDFTNLTNKKVNEGMGGAKDINENKDIKVGDIVSKKYASTDEDYTKEFKVINITGMGATLQDTKTGKKVGIFLNDLTKSPMKEATTDYSKRRQAQDDYAINKKDKPAKSYNPTPSGKTDYMKRRQKEIAEAIIAKLKK
jgi:hypothetical protein